MNVDYDIYVIADKEENIRHEFLENVASLYCSDVVIGSIYHGVHKVEIVVYQNIEIKQHPNSKHIYTLHKIKG